MTQLVFGVNCINSSLNAGYIYVIDEEMIQSFIIVKYRYFTKGSQRMIYTLCTSELPSMYSAMFALSLWVCTNTAFPLTVLFKNRIWFVWLTAAVSFDFTIPVNHLLRVTFSRYTTAVRLNILTQQTLHHLHPAQSCVFQLELLRNVLFWIVCWHCAPCHPSLSSSSIGNRVHNPGPGAAAPEDLSERSIRPDAGLLAERAAHETQHQRNPLSAPQSGQSLTCIPGYTGLNTGGP